MKVSLAATASIIGIAISTAAAFHFNSSVMSSEVRSALPVAAPNSQTAEATAERATPGSVSEALADALAGSEQEPQVPHATEFASVGSITSFSVGDLATVSVKSVNGAIEIANVESRVAYSILRSSSGTSVRFANGGSFVTFAAHLSAGRIVPLVTSAPISPPVGTAVPGYRDDDDHDDAGQETEHEHSSDDAEVEDDD
jgi:hypothetical protein